MYEFTKQHTFVSLRNCCIRKIHLFHFSYIIWSILAQRNKTKTKTIKTKKKNTKTIKQKKNTKAKKNFKKITKIFHHISSYYVIAFKLKVRYNAAPLVIL